MDASFIFHFLAAILVMVGIAGVAVPVLPGIPLVFAGLLVAAWGDDFVRVGWPSLLILGLMTLLSFVVDFLATAFGAQRAGGSRWAVWGSVLGSLIGLFFLPWGLLLGPFAGAFIAEYWHGRRLGKATRIGLHAWLGLLLGTAFKLALAFAMIGIFLTAWFF